ncbi:hypothetical protein, partial [Limosilactobacillus reuteri]|uniref:hypothetical protein n=1 Tax=Limosilactobacillus reuteri TaxID=1598 RepID=UPI00159F205F
EKKKKRIKYSTKWIRGLKTKEVVNVKSGEKTNIINSNQFNKRKMVHIFKRFCLVGGKKECWGGVDFVWKRRRTKKNEKKKKFKKKKIRKRED